MVETFPSRIRTINEEDFAWRTAPLWVEHPNRINVYLAELPQPLEGRMPSVAHYGSTSVVENESGYLDIGAASRLAAESARSKLAATSASPRQREALVEAMRLILIGETEKAKDELSKGGFSEEAIEEIFPLLLRGLTEEA